MDTYKTISSPAQGVYKEKGSRFLAFAYPVASADEVKVLVDEKRREYHDARHVCYAYVLGAERTNFRANDDGEPSGTAGRPILGQLNATELTDTLIIVVRYFGGILLGASGLAVAYKTAAADAIAASNIVEKVVESRFNITCQYAQLSRMLRLVKEQQLRLVSQQQTDVCTLHVAVRQSSADALKKRLTEMAFEGISFEEIKNE